MKILRGVYRLAGPALVGCAALALAACRPGPLGDRTMPSGADSSNPSATSARPAEALPDQALPAAALPAHAGSGPAPAADLQIRKGALVVKVAWPPRSYQGFSAQTIPTSTNALVVDVRNRFGALMIHEVLLRPSAGGSVPTTTREFALVEGTDYSIGAWAFRDLAAAQSEPPDESKAIASGNSLGLEIQWGRQTAAKVVLAPVFAPAITGLSAANGGRGMVLSISGDNFGQGDTPPAVIFPSLQVAQGTLKDGRIDVKIPAGAGSGTLKVRVDGVLSETSVPFKEIRTLALDTSGAGNRLAADGAIHSWLGDTFPLPILALDPDGEPVSSPSVTVAHDGSIGQWEAGAGASYTGIALGPKDLVRVTSGDLVASATVVVAPPAGPLIPLGSANTAARDGLALAQTGPDRYLAAYYQPGDKNLWWQILRADGTADLPLYGRAAAEIQSENVVKVAARAQEALIAHLGSGGRTVVLRSVDPVTGSPTLNASGSEVVWSIYTGATDSVRIADLQTNGQSYLLVYWNWNSSVWDLRQITFDINAATLSLLGSGTFGYAARNLIPPSEDSLGIAVKGTTFNVVHHMLSDQGQSAIYLESISATGSIGSYRKGWLHTNKNRIGSVATNGDSFLWAYTEIGAGTSSIRFFRYGADFQELNEDLPVSLDDIGLSGGDPQIRPVKVIWDGQQYVVAYEKANSTFEGGVPRTTYQPYIRCVSANGQVLGPAWPLAASGTGVTLVARPDGAMAVWLDDNKRPVARRIKLR